jgi:hypothetical protein
MIFTTNHPLVEANTIKLYYGGFDVTHGATGGKAGVGLATLRKDGFASLDAGTTPGTITTRRLSGARGLLRVNYMATDGWLKVEVLDERGNALPSYNRDACRPLTGDRVDHVVTWEGREQLPGIKGPLTLRFVLQNASLYAFAAGDGLVVCPRDGQRSLRQ